MQPRWKRAIARSTRQMGEALGQLYVEKYFPPAAKKRMDELVKNLMVAYRERIETRDWMGPETKKAGPRQARRRDAENRLSRQVARLLDARYQRRFVRAATSCAPKRSRSQLRVRQARQAGRPRRMAHDAAHGERLLQPDHERNRVPRRHLAAAVFRPQSRRRRKLRRHRRRDRPRNHPRLRRPGQPLRRQRQPAQLVDRRRPHAFNAKTDKLVEAVRRLRCRSTTCTSTAS